MTDFKELREALDAVAPCGDWHKSGSAVDIDESGEWAPVRVEVRANKLINRKVAAYVYAANPAAIRSLLDRLEAAERDAERYRWLASRAHKNTAHDRYGNGAHWSIGFFAHDGRHALDAAIDAMKEQQP